MKRLVLVLQAKDSCAVGSSMFSIANIRDNILQKLETAELKQFDW